ncbi:MAG: hypothetical protein ACI92S_003367, partial [Planctomycetaceae bacterium]
AMQHQDVGCRRLSELLAIHQVYEKSKGQSMITLVCRG